MRHMSDSSCAVILIAIFVILSIIIALIGA
jgi:hypothetical protein